MGRAWNLTPQQWANVLGEGPSPDEMAKRLSEGKRFVPWTDTLLDLTAPNQTVLDLGCGHGEHSAVLASQRRRPTLVDWSENNLAYCRQLFDALGYSGTFCKADITKPLPFQNGTFDTVFCCGVFEYFTVDESDRILDEALRVSRKRVVLMVPNALSLPYRLGKWYLETHGRWDWGGEKPSYTQKSLFRRHGVSQIVEFSVAARQSLHFLQMPFGNAIKRFWERALRLTHDDKRSPFWQGYLLVTVGDKS